MADFAIDTSRIDALSSELSTLGKQVDDIAARVQVTVQSISGNPSLSNKNYPGRIGKVRGVIRTIGGETTLAANRLQDISSRYVQCEMRVMSDFTRHVSAENGYTALSVNSALAASAVLSNAELLQKANNDRFGDAWKETWDSYIGAGRDVSVLIENAHLWRSTEGSKMVEGFYDWVRGVEKSIFSVFGLGDTKILSRVIKKYIDDKNKDYTNLENVVYSALHPTNTEALVTGAASFTDLCGIGWIPELAGRIKTQVDEYVDKGTQMIVKGQVVEGLFTALGGSLLTAGDMVVDAAFKSVKTAVKTLVPGAKQVFNVVDYATEAIFGQSAEDWIDSSLGAIGDGIKGVFGWITGR